MALPATRTSTFQLTCDLGAPRTARRLVAVSLRQWGVSDVDLLDAALVVVSELVTNVLVHCDDGGPVTVQLALHDGHLRLAVEDGSPAVPSQRRAAPDALGGRGLDIVAQLAAQWEVERLEQGKRVVVDLPLRAPESA